MRICFIKRRFTKPLLLFFGFQASLYAAGQNTNPYNSNIPINFIRTWDVVAPETDGNILMNRPVKDVKTTTQYFDGLGRPLQTVMKEASWETGSTTPIDMVSTNMYDDFGREQYKYLPFPANNTDNNPHISDGLFKYNPYQQQAAFMATQYNGQGESHFHSKTNFESSPLSRIEKSMAPGANWVGSNRGVEAKYWINTIIDDVRIWNVFDNAGTFGSYTSTAAYPAGELYKNVTVDEHGKQVIEFKDKEGKVILKKVQIATSPGTEDDGTGRGYPGWLCTYYIYDNLNNLRAVIQPQGVNAILPTFTLTSDLLNEQCFRYEYDARNRMIKKKVPGAGEVYMVYDGRDRLVMTQDANMRNGSPAKWMITKYDILNRPIETGLWNNDGNSFTSHLSNAYNNSTGYPTTATGYEELSKTFYDDYSWLATNGNPFAATYNNSYDTYFQTVSNSVWPYAQPNAQTTQLKGMATGSKVKVLGTSTYLYTMPLYDEKGRTIQVFSKNNTGGTDIATTQYTWAGQSLVIVQIHQKGGFGAQETIVVSQMTYDHLGRVEKTEKKVSNTLVPVNGNMGAMSDYKTIAEIKYDKLGQLKEKKLAPAYNFSAGLETLSYDYNIRGWMLGMNRSYLVAQGQSGTNRFGFELAYDKQNSSSGRSYDAPLFNGNISGMVWKSDGDDVKRKYDFIYDAANRLLKGEFEQDDATTTWNSSTMNYSMQMGNGVDAETAYDMNGNIKAMKQYGWKLGGNSLTPIDDLSYNYRLDGLSNQLLNVFDLQNLPDTKLGDFRTSLLHEQSKTPTTVDYTYDANGNLKKDLNKDIGTAALEDIVYNHLNLPQTIIVRKTGGAIKGTINYIYDAAGNKLVKTTQELGITVALNQINYTTHITTSTNYVGSFIYESKSYSNSNLVSLAYTDKLQFLGHEEGRVRFKEAIGSIPASLQYDYMLKDHLGNVRMVLTEEQQQDTYPAATLEDVTHNGGTAISVEDDFYTINATNIVPKSSVNGIPDYQNNNGNPPHNNNPYSHTTANSDQIYRLNATVNTNVNKTGLGIALKVMAGDNINIFGKSYHRKPSGGVYNGPTNNIILSELIDALAGTGVISSKGATGAQIIGQAGFPGSVPGLIGNQPAQDDNRPRASINWIVLDDQFKYVSGGFDMVGTDASGNGVLKNHDLGTIPTIAIPKNGYIYVYCSNESKFDVFFDNLQLIHTRGPVLEETHYYPFGLTMNGISSKALSFGGSENKKKYQGYEHNTDFDLNTYETFYRTHDPQIGRWWQIDPKPESGLQYSPYVAMNNNPISLTDLLGDIVEYEKGDGVSKKEFRRFKREIRQMTRNSETFAAVFAEFSKSDKVYTYKAVQGGGGETVKTDKGYEMSVSMHAKFPEQKNDKGGRVEQIGHETGHAWLKTHNKEPIAPVFQGDPTRTFQQATEALSQHNIKYAEFRNNKEITPSHIGNIISSELINSGSLNFGRLKLAEFYYSGFGTRFDVKSGVTIAVEGIRDIPLLNAPRTKSYYLNTKFDIYAEFGVKKE